MDGTSTSGEPIDPEKMMEAMEEALQEMVTIAGINESIRKELEGKVIFLPPERMFRIEGVDSRLNRWDEHIYIFDADKVMPRMEVPKPEFRVRSDWGMFTL